MVIPTFYVKIIDRTHTDNFNLGAGVIPPMLILEHSMLYVQSHLSLGAALPKSIR